MDPPDAPWLEGSEFPVHAMGTRASSYGYSSRFVPWLRERAKCYDVVVVNGLWQYSSLGVLRGLSGTGTPYVVFPHGMLDPWFNRYYPMKRLKKALYWPWAEYRVLKHASAVIFTSETERVLARRSFWPYCCEEHVATPGIRSPEGNPDEQRSLFFDAHPELCGKRILLFLGRIHEKKGCGLLIEAFARVQQTIGQAAVSTSGFHLVIAGPSANSNYLDGLMMLAAGARLQASISFIGMLAGDLKWGAFYAAEAFVLPSHQENFGVAVAEALACGVPVLISDKVNIWREIQEDQAGIIAPDTLEGAETMLETWCLLPELDRQVMRSAARRCFERRFEVMASAQRLIKVLNAVTSRTCDR